MKLHNDISQNYIHHKNIYHNDILNVCKLCPAGCSNLVHYAEGQYQYFGVSLKFNFKTTKL
jgi:hypothetical protein